MKKFFIDIFSFLLFWMVFIQCSYLLVDNKYWGRSDYTIKYQYFKENQDKFNTLFLGSSRVQTGVVPALFDSLTAAKQLHSFNLSVSQLLNPEIYFLYDQILADESLELTHVFMELTALHSIPIQQIQYKNSFYWHNLKYLNYTANYLLHLEASYTKKIGLTGIYLVSYLNKFLTIDHLFTVENKTDCSDWEKHRGSCLYNKKFINKGYIKTKKDWQEAYQFGEDQSRLNEFYLRKLNELIAKSKDRGIQLIFFIPPRLDALEYKEVVNISKHLPAQNILTITNIDEYPALYTEKHSRDVGHLNEKGAKVFTQLLVQNFLKRKVME